MTSRENDTRPFRLWWQELNELLASCGQSEALYGDARYFFCANYSPMTAASLIAENRYADPT